MIGSLCTLFVAVAILCGAAAGFPHRGHPRIARAALLPEALAKHETLVGDCHKSAGPLGAERYFPIHPRHVAPPVSLG